MKSVFTTLLLLLTISFTNIANESATIKIDKEKEYKLLVFSGIDWCAPCIKLKKLVWDDATWQDYADANIDFEEIAFPRNKKLITKEELEANEKLAEQYNPNGNFPYMVLVDQDGKVVKSFKSLGYTPTDYVNYIKSIIE